MCKTLWNFEPHPWLEIIAPHDARSACSRVSKTSCDVIASGAFKGFFVWTNRITGWVYIAYGGRLAPRLGNTDMFQIYLGYQVRRARDTPVARRGARNPRPSMLHVRMCHSKCDQPWKPPPSPFWQLTRTMVWVLPARKLGPWSEFPFLYIFIYSTLEFWRFKFSVVWVLVWVSSFYGDGGGSRTVKNARITKLIPPEFSDFLLTRPKWPPYRETPVALPLWHCFLWCSQTIAATPQLLSIETAYRSPKTGLGGRVSQKRLASEAYRVLGGIACNSIANRAIVGH